MHYVLQKAVQLPSSLVFIAHFEAWCSNGVVRNTSEQIQLFVRVKAISGVMDIGPDVRALLTEDIALIRS